MALLSYLFVFLALLAATVAAAGAVNAELAALLAVKEALDPGGRVLGSWTPTGDPCAATSGGGGGFEGVSCDSRSRVVAIALQGRGLSGKLAPAIAGLPWLTGLYLHYNGVKGEIPRELGNLTRLTDLYLDVNHLTGEIPEEIGSMARLQVLQLGYNQLSGSIPSQLSQLSNLTVLALQSNNLTGAIPAALADLSQLTRLDLSFNRLFGSIPSSLAGISPLRVLDLRNNSLSGSVPSGLKRLNAGFQFAGNVALCGGGYASLAVCPSTDVGALPGKPEPFDSSGGAIKTRQVPQLSAGCRGSGCGGPSSVLVFGAVAAVVAAGALFVLFAVLRHRRLKQKIGSAGDASDSRRSTDQPKEVFRRSVSPLIGLDCSGGWDGGSFGELVDGVGSLRLINLDEVERATQYFAETNLLGRSSFAVTFKGVLRDGTPVAVKRIGKASCRLEEAEFADGLRQLSHLRHDNLVALRGFCCSRGRRECFLLHDYVANGPLSNYLDASGAGGDNTVLDWPTRVAVVTGVAKAIEYLHSATAEKPPLVHRSVSADKILLGGRFSPKLAGAGLHRLLADDVVFSSIKASAAMGYLPPEYAETGRFTEKSDVYAFGVVVLQVVAGRREVSQLQRLLGAGGVRPEAVVDERLNGEYSRSEAAVIVGVAMACVCEVAAQRPAMSAVVQQLMAC